MKITIASLIIGFLFAILILAPNPPTKIYEMYESSVTEGIIKNAWFMGYLVGSRQKGSLILDSVWMNYEKDSIRLYSILNNVKLKMKYPQ